MRALTARRIREIEAAWMARSGEDALTLMERAAAGAMESARAMARPGVWVVLCGPGNNGGDGQAMARMRAEEGGAALALLVGDPERMSPSAVHQWKRAEQSGVILSAYTGEALPEDAGLIIDALLGTGIARQPTGDMARAIAAINRSCAPVLSIDLPSGLDATLGQVLGEAVRADETAAMGWPKTGLLLPGGRAVSGRLTVVPLGIPESFLREDDAEVLDPALAVGLMPARPLDGHKGTFGRVLLLAGRSPFAGAAALCALGALRGGAGLVRVLTDGDSRAAVRAAAPEAVALSLDEADLASEIAAADALGVGPGLGDAPDLLQAVLQAVGEKPLLLDADALNVIARDRQSIPIGCVITPHPGEMARLTGLSVGEIVRDPVGIACSFAQEHRCVVLLKGATTVIAAPDGRRSLNLTGNPGMATGGSGDVLSGLIGALLGQGLLSYDAARLGAWLHGSAGDLAAEEHGQRGMIAGDIARALGKAWRALEHKLEASHRMAQRDALASGYSSMADINLEWAELGIEADEAAFRAYEANLSEREQP